MSPKQFFYRQISVGACDRNQFKLKEIANIFDKRSLTSLSETVLRAERDFWNWKSYHKIHLFKCNRQFHFHIFFRPYLIRMSNGKMWWKDLKNFHFLFEETICLCGTHFRFFLSFFERKCGKWMPDRQAQSEFAYMYVCGTSVSIVIVNPHKIPGVMVKYEIFHSHRNHSLNRP